MLVHDCTADCAYRRPAKGDLQARPVDNAEQNGKSQCYIHMQFRSLDERTTRIPALGRPEAHLGMQLSPLRRGLAPSGIAYANQR
jgi:hypothetical protein